jgi:hypothetical protein
MGNQEVFYKHGREHRHQISLADFFLQFGGKPSGDNRCFKLAEIIPCDELENYYATQFYKELGVPGSCVIPPGPRPGLASLVGASQGAFASEAL